MEQQIDLRMQVSTLPGENFLNSSHSSLKMLLGDMFSQLRTSRHKLRELLSLLQITQNLKKKRDSNTVYQNAK